MPTPPQSRSVFSGALSHKALSCWALALALGAAVGFGASRAPAAVVERIVAIVDDRPILLSDLRARAKPFLLRIHNEVPAGAQRNAAISQLYKELLDRVIDEALQQRAAAKNHLSVSQSEIDDALARVASQNNVTPDEVLAEARRNGLTDEQYRQELRQQLLEAKLLNLRLQGRIRVTESDLRAAHQRLVANERQELEFRAAWIRVRAPRDSGAEAAMEKQAALSRIAREARKHGNFGELARRHSEDAATRNDNGLLPRQLPRALPESLRAVAVKLEVGEVSTPVRDGDDLVLLHMVERAPSRVPAFDAARAELGQAVYLEKMNKARRHWLDTLRRRTHVEVRL